MDLLTPSSPGVFQLFVFDHKKDSSERKPNSDDGIVAANPRPKTAYDYLGLVYCFNVLLCVCLVPRPHVTLSPTPTARYSLSVLKMPLNTNQLSN